MTFSLPSFPIAPRLAKRRQGISLLEAAPAFVAKVIQLTNPSQLQVVGRAPTD